MNTEFTKFITLAGGDAEAAKALNCSVGLISHIRTGKRDVSKQVAKNIIDQFPEISLSRLLYPEGKAA